VVGADPDDAGPGGAGRIARPLGNHRDMEAGFKNASTDEGALAARVKAN
jgi:hypothetical protein